MKQHAHILRHYLTIIIGITIIAAGTGLVLPVGTAAASYPILKVGNDFTISGTSAAWRGQASTTYFQEEVTLDKGRQADLQIYLLYNDAYLFWGVDIQGFQPNCADDYSPDFSGSDHLKLQFNLRIKGKEYPGSILILPDSIFETPLVTPDYSYYQGRFGFPGDTIQVAAFKKTVDAFFIMLTIPYTALGADTPTVGDTLDFKTGFCLTGSLGQKSRTIWVPTPGDSQEYSTAQFD